MPSPSSTLSTVCANAAQRPATFQPQIFSFPSHSPSLCMHVPTQHGAERLLRVGQHRALPGSSNALPTPHNPNQTWALGARLMSMLLCG